METLRLEQSDDSPLVVLDQEGNQFEISGKSLPEDVIDFYQPVISWLEKYRSNPNPKTIFNFKLIYFNTASSKLILDILMIFEEMVEEGNEVLIRWFSLKSDEDMQEAGKEYEEMVEVPFEHLTYDN
jgi:SiaC family regulatory phosphoprotein